MAYTPLYQKYFTPYHRIPDRLVKPESIKYKVFLTAVGNYALTMDAGFYTLARNRDMECAIHLLRMVLDASIKTYGLLLAKNPEKYINDYLKGVHKGEYASRSDSKIDGRALTTGYIVEQMDKDGYPITKLYDDFNSYIHPSNFYCLGVELPEEARKWLWEKQEDALISNYTKLGDKETRDWVCNTMELINDLLLEIMGKVVEMIEPPTVNTITKEIIDITTGKIVPNPNYKPK